ncbi:MAG: archaeosine synthase subunit alpha [Euryarchaeota archaeon]|nr:archaeosine synthase subunit alpha [Euryarchaeota archaeon]
MQFTVKKRDGPARIGELTIDQSIVTTPTILYVHTTRCTAPDFADMLLTNNIAKTQKPALKVLGSIFSKENVTANELTLSDYLLYPKDVPTQLHKDAFKHIDKKNAGCVIVPADPLLIPDITQDSTATIFIVANAAQLFSQQSAFISFIIQLREHIGYQKTIYLPCLGDPTNLAVFTYMGIDLFDSMAAVLAARNNIFLFSTGPYQKNDLSELPCSCPACTNAGNDPSKMGYPEILQHNNHGLYNELKQIRNAITQGQLRELVEIRVRAHPELTAVLRHLDSDHYPFLEERTSLIRKHPLIATTKEALTRPEVRRFQERVIHRYKKPKNAKILLLLPCSSKKPYSFSKSHNLFQQRLFGAKNPSVVHELIITSPLGVVPRELELIPPASSYDISVTGHWDEDEKHMIRTLLQTYLKKNKYETVIIHLPLGLAEFVTDLFVDPIITCTDKPTSEESLHNLSLALEKTTVSYDNIPVSIRVKENMKAIANFQFDEKAADILFNESEVRGKYPYWKLLSNKKQIGMITQERGFLSLTLDGAERLKQSGTYWVDIADDFILKGSLFAPGVKDADSLIRIGDEVVVTRNKLVCGVGVAQMNGTEMKESTKGEAVKLRHIA